MNEKNNKKRNTVLSTKNLTVVGITAVAVVLFAMIMTYIMPKSTTDKNFDNKAWREAVSEANNAGAPQNDDSRIYNQAAEPANTNAVPVQSDKNKTEATAQESDANPVKDAKAADNGDIPAQESKQQSGEKLTMQMPVGGAVLNDYSGDNLVYSKTMRDWRTHNGIDFAANEGDDVLAAADGTVEAITDNGMLGKTVIILHDGGIRSIYSNLAEEESVAVGDNVLSGSIIGKVGNTAAAEVSENPHLHFEVSLNEEPVNPHDYILQSENNSADLQD